MWPYFRKYRVFAFLAVLFMAAEVAADLLLPSLMQTLVDKGVLGLTDGGQGSARDILLLGFTMIAIVAGGAVCGSLNSVFVNLTSQNIGNDVRKKVFRRIMRFSFPQLDSFGSGTLITRMTNDVSQVQSLVSQLIRGGVRTTLMIAGSIYFMHRLNPEFGLIVLAAVPVMAFCAAGCVAWVKPLFPKLQSRLDQLNEILQEDISGIRVIKAFGRELYERIRFGRANNRLIRMQLKILLAFSFLSPAMNLLMSLVVVVALLYRGSVLTGSGAATPGEIMAGITYTGRLLVSILILVMLSQMIARGFASWRRLREVLTVTPGFRYGDAATGPGPQGEVEFRDVTFGYPRLASPIFSGVSLRIRSGETVAVMGATGCGKTALAGLIPRFYDPDAGTVLIDGLDVRSYSREALLGKVSFALQKSELFSATVRENIAWGKPDATDEEIRAAAAAAQADEFIAKLPDGYDTLLTEGGTSLSGGQRQRIALARAILKPAEILILDDATSALDTKTEAAFFSALSRFAPGVTKIVVAQRISTARRADRIIVLEKGRIAGVGTHEELLQNCAAYQEIAASQSGRA